MHKTHPKNEPIHPESTESSIASGSSDVINAMDNAKITNAINKEVDKIFGPALERTSSGGDLKVVAPLRNKRRQYRSQEVLALDETTSCNQSHSLATSLPSQSEIQINKVQNNDKDKIPRVSILQENQRAEIVASVTERLYSKLKKKEQAAVSKIESVVDRKMMEPLSELRICSNARQRLLELSQRAIKNKRRIGIPAYTQTRVTVIRVKDQGIDVQTDLDPYIVKHVRSFTLYRDVSTETMPMTPRCKEIAVGPQYGSLKRRDRATVTEGKKVVYKNSMTMTDVWPKDDRYTQTHIMPPPRRKKRGMDVQKCTRIPIKNIPENSSIAPIISINITQTYPTDSETPESSDDNLEHTLVGPNYVMTPDLLTNHTADTNENLDKQDLNISDKSKTNYTCGDRVDARTNILETEEYGEDFSDNEDYWLPRVTVESSTKTKYTNIKDIILGRNENMYPYNIVLSPSREKDNSKRVVHFKDFDVAREINVPSQADCGLGSIKNTSNDSVFNKEPDETNDGREDTHSDSTDSYKIETDSFIWKSSGTTSKTLGCLRRNYVPVYKSNPRYKTAKARLYREFLGLKNHGDDVSTECCSQCPAYKNEISSSGSVNVNDESEYITKFKNRKQFLDEKCKNRDTNKNDNFESIEEKILDSCNELKKAANDYEDYNVATTKVEIIKGNRASTRTPTKFLQHLIDIRREMVKNEGDTTDNSYDSSRK